MFNNLFDFEYKRSPLEALGFYIVFLIIGVLSGGILGGLAAILSGAQGYAEGAAIGRIIGPVYALIYFSVISGLILVKKMLYKNAWAIILFLLTVFISLIMGGIISCIFCAILSTFQSEKKEDGTT